MKLGDDGRHDIQDLGISCIRDVAIVINKHGFKQWWDDVVVDHFEVIGFLNVAVDKLKNLLLDCPQATDFWCFRSNRAYKT